MIPITLDRFVVTREIRWECGCYWNGYETQDGKGGGSQSGPCKEHKFRAIESDFEEMDSKPYPKLETFEPPEDENEIMSYLHR